MVDGFAEASQRTQKKIGITTKNNDFCHTLNQIVQSSNIHSEREKQLGGGEATDSAERRLLQYLIPSLHSTCCVNAQQCHQCSSAVACCVHQHSGCFLSTIFGSWQEASWAGECSFQALCPSFIHNSVSVCTL